MPEPHTLSHAEQLPDDHELWSPDKEAANEPMTDTAATIEVPRVSVEERADSVTESLDDVIEAVLELHELNEDDRNLFNEEIALLVDHAASQPVDPDRLLPTINAAAREMAAHPERMMNIGFEATRAMDQVVMEATGGVDGYMEQLTPVIEQIDAPRPSSLLQELRAVYANKPAEAFGIAGELAGELSGANEADTTEIAPVFPTGVAPVQRVTPLLRTLGKIAVENVPVQVRDEADDWLDDVSRYTESLETTDYSMDALLDATDNVEPLGEDADLDREDARTDADNYFTMSEILSKGDAVKDVNNIETLHRSSEYRLLSDAVDGLIAIVDGEHGSKQIEFSPQFADFKKAVLSKSRDAGNDLRARGIARQFFDDLAHGEFKTLKMLQREAQNLQRGLVELPKAPAQAAVRESLQREQLHREVRKQGYEKGRKRPYATRREEILSNLEEAATASPTGPEAAMYKELAAITPDRYRQALSTVKKAERGFFKGIKTITGDYKNAKALVAQVQELLRRASEQ